MGVLLFLAIAFFLEDTVPRYFGLRPLIYFETESSKSQFLAGSLTQSAYLYAELAKGSGPGFDYRLDRTENLEDALHIMGHSIISLTVMAADIKAEQEFSDPYKLHIRHYAVDGGYRYPIFSNDEIDAQVKSDNPQDYLNFLGVSTDGITGPR